MKPANWLILPHEKSEITHNELNLNEKFMEFVEVYEGHYLNDIIKESSEYKEWVKNHSAL